MSVDGVVFEGDIELPGSADLYGQAADLVAAATAAGTTLATAESCTGGLVGGAITAVPGSSEAYLGGIVSYACSVKEAVLGVPHEVIATVGAVSEECVRAMAAGARKVTGADVAVSVSGIAGPGGAVPGKPVGTVWFACARPNGTVCERHVFSGDRDGVRAKSVSTALRMLREAVGSVVVE